MASSAIGDFVIGVSPIGIGIDAQAFPPKGPTTLTKVIPSYIYQEYNDDDDCLAFAAAQNGQQQLIIDWFAQTFLPVYTGDPIFGDLLNWVAAGVYGLNGRPALPSGTNKNVGPLNTWVLNFITLNTLEIIDNQDFYATTDDVLKRILTWHFYKGDGKYFDIQWLKRRVMRFLTGMNGTAGQTDDLSLISVSFGVGNQVNIGIANGTRTVTSSSTLNSFALNTTALNELDSTFHAEPPFPFAGIFKAAVDAGVLELPFQFTWVVNIT